MRLLKVIAWVTSHSADLEPDCSNKCSLVLGLLCLHVHFCPVFVVSTEHGMNESNIILLMKEFHSSNALSFTRKFQIDF